MKNLKKVFYFIACHTKLELVLGLCVIGLIKLMDLLGFMMAPDI